MILNWDVHASDGTKDIFYCDPMVLTMSLHQNPTNFFPRQGWTHEIGAEAGEGYTVNVPLPSGSGDAEYLMIFDSIVAPIHRQFGPHYLIVECGFDAHHQDPLANQRLTTNGYYELARRLLLLRKGGIILTLEGGYNFETIGQIACALFSALLGEPNPFPEELHEGQMGGEDLLSYSLMSGSIKSKAQSPRRADSIEAVIRQLQGSLGKYWALPRLT